MTLVRVSPTQPYSFEATVASFTRFSDECVDVVRDGCYRRLIDVGGELVLVEARDAADEVCLNSVEIRVLNADRVSERAAARGIGAVRRLLALDEPIQPVIDLVDALPQISRLNESLCGLRRALDLTPFEGLVSSILAQLISIRGAATVRARLVNRFGSCMKHQSETWWTFADPESLARSSVDELCGEIRMTSVKARAILAIARAAIEGELELEDFERLEDKQVIARLLEFPGVGRWTAEWFMVNVLGRMTMVPIGDLGIRRSTGRWFFGGDMPTPEQVRTLYDPLGEHRAYVAYYVLSAERLRLQPEA